MGDMFGGGGGGGGTVDVTNMGYSGLSQQKPGAEDDLLGTYNKALARNSQKSRSEQLADEQKDRLARLMED